jgi:hypothetical protein
MRTDVTWCGKLLKDMTRDELEAALERSVIEIELLRSRSTDYKAMARSFMENDAPMGGFKDWP